MLTRIANPASLNTFTRFSARASVLQNHLMSASTSASTEDVILEKIGDKGVITLNRPKALNALDLSMIRKIYPQLKKWTDESQVKFVIIKGTGGKAFCAGGDVRAIAEARTKEDKSIQRDFFREEYILNHSIGTLKVPWIALIDGITMGGGVGLSVHGKYRVATEKTVFAMPETAIGLFPDVGGGYFLPRLAGMLGMYLALTGFRLKGRDVHWAGVATHFIESAKLPNLESELLALKSSTPDDLEGILNTFHNECTVDKDKPFVLGEHLEKINRIFGAPTLEEIFDNLKQEKSKWADSQLETLQKMSPSSMKITVRQLKEGAALDLRQVLQMEYRLTQRIMSNNDFFEGVRAVLIDRDQKPVWNPATIEGVTPKIIDSYFAKLPSDLELKL